MGEPPMGPPIWGVYKYGGYTSIGNINTNIGNNLREYTYVPHGSGIVDIRSHERHAAEPRIATGRDLDVQGGSKRSVTVNCKNAYKSNGTLKNTS